MFNNVILDATLSGDCIEGSHCRISVGGNHLTNKGAHEVAIVALLPIF